MDDEFEQLAKALMDELLSWDPAYSTQLGWHKYDWRLRDPSIEEHEREIQRCDELIEELRGIDVSQLSPDQALDRDLALYLLHLKLFETRNLRLYERNSTACGEIGYSLFFLFSRDYPALDKRIAATIHRLEQVPRFLSQSMTTLRNPYRVWCEASWEIGREIPDFMRDILEMAERNSVDRSSMERLRAAVARATKAVADHNKWLQDEIMPRATDENAISPAEYSKYLELRGYGMTADEALEVGETYLRLVKNEMISVARSVDESKSVPEALQMMKSNHPATFGEALHAYRDSAADARDFLVKADLMTIPDGERLVIVETPQFMRPMTPFAAQYEPGKFDGSRTGMFMVTPDDGNPDYLREHNYATIGNTTVHEGYPGHHLQGICANTNQSYIRTLVSSPDFSEGWGLYVEDLMISRGYNDDPLGRLTNLNDLQFRIVRLIVDIKLAKGLMTLSEAAQMLADECVIDPKAARIEARSCGMAPTYFSSYFLGKMAIMQMREEVEKAMGGKFSLKFFHDALLYAGCMPVPFMRRAVALRLKEIHGIELGGQKETLYEYSMRKAREKGV